MAEWLRRLTRNQMGSSRGGSNPTRSVGFLAFFCLRINVKISKIWPGWGSNPQCSDSMSDALSIGPRGRLNRIMFFHIYEPCPLLTPHLGTLYRKFRQDYFFHISEPCPLLIHVLSNRLAGRKCFSEEANCGPARLLAGKFISSEDDPLMKFFETSKYIPARLTWLFLVNFCKTPIVGRKLCRTNLRSMNQEQQMPRWIPPLHTYTHTHTPMRTWP